MTWYKKEKRTNPACFFFIFFSGQSSRFFILSFFCLLRMCTIIFEKQKHKKKNSPEFFFLYNFSVSLSVSIVFFHLLFISAHLSKQSHICSLCPFLLLIVIQFVFFSSFLVSILLQICVRFICIVYINMKKNNIYEQEDDDDHGQKPKQRSFL